MYSQLLFKLSFKKILIYLSLIILTYEQQQCIFGKNCPVNQGLCVSDMCICSEGYHTLLAENTPIDQQIFCNYKKISQYTPIIFEIFLPSIGHFIVGNYWLGIIKLSLLLAYVISSYKLYGKVSLPHILKVLFEKIGLGIFLGNPGKIRNDNLETIEKIFKTIFCISSTFFSLMFFVDLFCYKFGVYTDGNGVPFVWIKS